MPKPHSQSSDEDFMKRALALAAKGAGRVSPNPMVGCVIARGGKILAQGWHKKFGGDHAELDALKKLKGRAKGATLYVTLEPCHHFGKTPPCVDAVIKAGVARVVIAMRDPNPLTAGKSIRKLKKAGIKVTLGTCEEDARFLNRAFLKWITTRMPYVTAKVAMSLDGKITTQKGKQGWITGPEAKRFVHELRSQVDAVLVGKGTVAIDDPQLNVREGVSAATRKRRAPIRVVLDSKLTTKLDRKLFKTHGGNVLFFSALVPDDKRVRAFNAGGVRVFCSASKDRPDWGQVLSKLGSLGIASLLVEGGSEVFSSLLKAEMADEWLFLIASKWVGKSGLAAFGGKSGGPESILGERSGYVITDVSRLGEDVLVQVVRNSSFF